MPIFFALIFVLLSASAHAESSDCPKVREGLQMLSTSKDPVARSHAGTCLVRSHIDDANVARTVLGVLRDSREDILLKEDLIEAFAECSLRRTIRSEHSSDLSLGAQEKEAVDRNLGSVGGILAAAEA